MKQVGWMYKRKGLNCGSLVNDLLREIEWLKVGYMRKE